jgi:hypothetical protein
MRYFHLLGAQDVILYLVPTLIFIIVFGMALGYAHFHREDAEARQKKIYTRFAEDIEDRKAPFPLAMALIMIGTILWMAGYILITGWIGVKI